MPSRRPLYRQQALDKLASPEELDRLMQITRPGSWLLLAGFGGVLLVILVWGIFGRITTPLEVTGTLTLSNPVVFISAPAGGQVLDVDVQPGDLVAANDVLARVATPEGAAEVTSAASGRVLSVRVRPGEPVDEGTPLLSLETFENAGLPEEVIAFVPLEERQRIRAGMDALVLPSTVERERYGYMEGTVASVAAFAATREEMLAVLGDASFVDDLAAAGPLFEMRVSLKTEAQGVYVWTASDGPDTPVVIGTPCLVRITLDRERPISRVFNLSS